MILSPIVLLPQVYGFLFIVSCIQSFDFTLISHFDFLYVGFISSSNRLIAKLKKGVEQSKPHADKPKQSKLAVVKNTSSKPKRRSQWIASKLEFSNTQDDPIEIEEVEEEVSMQRGEIVFTEDEKKNKIVQWHLREVIPPTTFQNLKMAIF